MFAIDEIRAAMPIRDALQARGIHVRNGRCPCPFCGTGPKSQALSVRNERFRCFACGKHGDVIDLVARFDGLSLRGAIRRCAELAGVRATSTEMPPRRAQRPAEGRNRREALVAREFRVLAGARDILSATAADETLDIGTRRAAVAGVYDLEDALDAILNHNERAMMILIDEAPR